MLKVGAVHEAVSSSAGRDGAGQSSTCLRGLLAWLSCCSKPAQAWLALLALWLLCPTRSSCVLKVLVLLVHLLLLALLCLLLLT